MKNKTLLIISLALGFLVILIYIAVIHFSEIKHQDNSEMAKQNQINSVQLDEIPKVEENPKENKNEDNVKIIIDPFSSNLNLSAESQHKDILDTRIEDQNEFKGNQYVVREISERTYEIGTLNPNGEFVPAEGKKLIIKEKGDYSLPRYPLYNPSFTPSEGQSSIKTNDK